MARFISVDVLSSGSELSGECASLFLSVWKQSSYYHRATNTPDSGSICAPLSELFANSTLQSRYSITGCSCDVLSRASADQRFSLSPIQAVFCSTNKLSELCTLPGLLYALQQSGKTGCLSICSMAPATKVQQLVELVHGRQAYPTVRVCEFPPSNDATWWKVYSDAHILVHVLVFSNIRNAPANDEDETCTPGVVYLFTLQQESDGLNTLLYIPETTPAELLPKIIDFTSDRTTCFPYLSSPAGSICLFGTILVRAETELTSARRNELALPVDWTVYYSHTSLRDDPNLLRRARIQHEQLCDQIPSDQRARMEHVLPKRRRHCVNDKQCSKRLRTGTSIVFDVRTQETTTKVAPVQYAVTAKIFDRILDQQTPPNQTVPTRDEDSSAREGTTNEATAAVENQQQFITSLQRFCYSEEPTTTTKDENEICIDSDDDEDEPTTPTYSKPYADLLVLGTGCASPSPYRGASGYVLRIAAEHNMQQAAVVLEVGEGFCTQWNRHDDADFRAIRIIWISHAHWDHYGGLIPLLLRIQCSGQQDHAKDGTAPHHKRRRKLDGCRHPPFVVAPRKVIEFLRLFWGASEIGTFFQQVSPTDRTSIANMCTAFNATFASCPKDRQLLISWDVVKVDHGCEAYGLILGLRPPNHPNRTFAFAFSGDTRPSDRFIWRCNTTTQAMGLQGVDFMLHEATYDEDQAAMSRAKKHSTIREALEVAQRTNTFRLLLTHFSQRYHRAWRPIVVDRQGTRPAQVLKAVDGMAIPFY